MKYKLPYFILVKWTLDLFQIFWMCIQIYLVVCRVTAQLLFLEITIPVKLVFQILTLQNNEIGLIFQKKLNLMEQKWSIKRIQNYHSV